MLKKLAFSGALLALTLGVAAPAFAENDGEKKRKENRPVITSTTVPANPCMQNAVSKRDNAIIAAFSKFSDATKAALETRKSALVAAWGMTDRKARREAIRTAWKSYRESMHANKDTMRKERRAAWETFRQERKACRIERLDDVDLQQSDNL